MRVRLTKVVLKKGVKDPSKTWLDVQGIKDDGSIFQAMCEAPEKTPEVDITPEELETYSSHEANFDIGRDQKAYLTDIKPTAE